MPEKSSGSGPDPKPHAHWEKVISAAYLRMIGHTQIQTAEAVGRSERSVRSWEADPELWGQARRLARSRWLSDAEDAARGAVLRSIGAGNADLGFRLLERIDDRLAPPKVRSEVTGEGGGPVEIIVTRRVVAPDNRVKEHMSDVAGTNGDGRT